MGRAYCRPCFSSSTSATPRPTSGPIATASWSSTGASPPCATSTADELGAALRNLLELRGLGLADLTPRSCRRRCRSCGPSGRRWPRATSATRCSSSGPGIKTGMALRYDNPREIGPDRLVNAVAAYDRVGGACVVRRLRHRDDLRPVSAEGEYLGGIICPASRSRWRR